MSDDELELRLLLAQGTDNVGVRMVAAAATTQQRGDSDRHITDDDDDDSDNAVGDAEADTPG